MAAGGDTMTTLTAPIEPLTPAQRYLVWAASIVVAATRFLALSRSMWEWDEALFASAVREYDVVNHNPHPPGFPLFIALAKLFRLVIHSDFRALQGVVLLGAIALFPLVFDFGRQLRFSFPTSFLGALLFTFFPNVWFFGGTSFSDIPGTALLIGASSLLIRGVGDRRAYLAGAFLLALAGGFRPQSLLAALPPALVASWRHLRQRKATVILGITVGVFTLTVIYGAAALASTSVRDFVAALEHQQKYLREVDSFRNAARVPLADLRLIAFVRPMRGPIEIAYPVGILALFALVVSLLRRRHHHGVWLLVAMFLPVSIFSWLMLDPAALTRYATGYLVMYGLLAAKGAEVVAGLIVRRRRALAVGLQALVIAVLTVEFARWTYPALREARSNSAPPAAVMEWITRHLDPARTRIIAFAGLDPFASYYLRKFDVSYVGGPEEIRSIPPGRDHYYITDRSTSAGGGRNFIRPRGRLWEIARQRYFEASIAPAAPVARFGDGWYPEEVVGSESWRWMSGHGDVLLPPLSGKARLALAFDLPLDVFSAPPRVSVTLNGQTLETIACTTPYQTREWIVSPRADRFNELVIATDQVANPQKLGRGGDARDLGLRLTLLAWGPAAR